MFNNFQNLDTYWLWKEIKNNSEGVEIYGWHYSDNSTMLPNTNQLFTYGKLQIESI